MFPMPTEQPTAPELSLVEKVANAGRTIERIKKARTWLNTYLPFLGYMTLKLRPREATERDNVPTAAVAPDGTLILNNDFVASLTDPQLRGLLCHEVLHPALLFFERLGLRELFLFNVSHDFIINLIIWEYAHSMGKSQDIELPPGGLFDRKWEKHSAEQVYDALQQDDNGGGDGPGGFPGDHGDCRPDLSSTSKGRKAAKGDAGAQRQLRQEWYVEVKAAEIAHKDATQGDLPGNLLKLVADLYEPAITWREYINNYVGEKASGGAELTYRRPSRRSESVGEILPGREKRTQADVTILWDTSGSMDGWERRILSEIDGMCQELNLTVRVLICDAEVHSDLEDCEEAADIIEGIKGGGGSDFRPAFRLLEEENDATLLIGFTDGWIGVPDTMPPQLKGILWVITEGGDKLPGGDCIVINAEGEVIG